MIGKKKKEKIKNATCLLKRSPVDPTKRWGGGEIVDAAGIVEQISPGQPLVLSKPSRGQFAFYVRSISSKRTPAFDCHPLLSSFQCIDSTNGFRLELMRSERISNRKHGKWGKKSLFTVQTNEL